MSPAPLALILAFAITGCASQTSPPVAAIDTPPPAGMASLAITRERGYYARLVSAVIEVNGAQVADLKVGETYVGSLRPGPNTITASCWCGPGRYSLKFNAEKGKRYVFLVSPRDEQMGASVFGALAGPVGVVAGLAVDAAANENSGTFKITAAN